MRYCHRTLGYTERALRMEKVTLNEVSELAGVSRSTASLVMRGSTRIPEATTARVQDAATKLGYIYNRQAANLRSVRSMTVGIIGADLRNPFFAEFMMAIEEALQNAGYTLLVGFNRDELTRQDTLIRSMVQHRVDGLILHPALGSTDESVGLPMRASGTPLIQVVRTFSDRFDYVGPDNVDAGRQLARHVVDIGARSAVFVGGPVGSSARVDRLRGVEIGLSGSDVSFDPAQATATGNNPEDAARGVSVVLDHGMLPDALITHSDAVAIGVYAELRRRGIEPGRDLAIASFDDVPLAGALLPPLTSVSTDEGHIGAQVTEALLARIADPQSTPKRTYLTSTLKVRASTAHWRRRF
jgi:LacI family transcriptional regulator